MVAKLMGAWWRITRRRALIYISLCAGLYLLVAIAVNGAGMYALAFPIAGIMGGYFLLNVTFDDEPIFLLTLAYTRKDITESYYAMYMACLALLYALLTVASAVLAGVGYGQRDINDGFLTALGINLLMGSAMIPIFIKWGYVKGRNIQLVAMLCIAVIFILLTKAGTSAESFIPAALAAIGVLAVLISFAISKRLMQNKEF